jgi:hypothetical protein
MKFMPRMSLDLVVNIVILITCAALGGAVVQRYYTSDARVRSEPTRLIKVGDRADALPGLSYAEARATLLLHVKSSCPYCTQSMAFYRRVREMTKQRQGVPFVVVGVESPDVLQRYLGEHGVAVDRVISAPGTPQPTPTLILVDSQGVVRDVWLGLQSAEGEQRVLRQIGSSGGFAATD